MNTYIGKFIRRARNKLVKFRLRKAGLDFFLTEICSEIAFFDVGASYFFAESWSKILYLKPGEVHLADPNGETINYLSNLPKNLKINLIDKAISREGGEKVFYVTNVKSGSSLLEPDVNKIQSNDTSPEIKEYFFPLEQKKIRTISTSELLGSSKMDKFFLKIDIQGYELELLKGCEEFLTSGQIKLIEVETSLLSQSFMKGSSSLKDVVSYMEPFGYKVLELKPVYRDFIDQKGFRHKGNLNECDLVFVADLKFDKFKNLQTIESIFLGYLMYGFHGLALELLEREPTLIYSLASKSLNIELLKKFVAARQIL